MKNEQSNDDKETGRQRQEKDLSQQGVSNIISKSNKRQYPDVIKYFSMFTGVGGFEVGLERANDISKTERFEQWGDEESSPINKPKQVARQQFTYVGLGNHRELRTTKRFKCIGFSEIDKYSCQVLKYRFPNIKNYGDATKINPSELPDFDMLCGGFPCQAFSIAGKRRGFDDTRGTMFFEIARILKIKRPKIILLENVKGLLNHEKGKTFSVILETLDELGYETQWMVLNSKFFGVPQNRERVFIIGNLRGTSRQEILPFRTKCEEIIKLQGQQIHPTITEAIGRQGSSSEYKQSLAVVNTVTGRLTADANGSYINECKQLPQVKAVHNIYGGFKEEPRFSDISPTIRTAKGGGHLPSITNGLKIRRLTPVECCRLQGFPDDWNEWGINENGEKVKMSDTKRYKQMGNAVTTNVITAIATQSLNKTSGGKE